MAMAESRLVDLSPETFIPASPTPPPTQGTRTPQQGLSPSHRANGAQNRRQQRHSKKLSLNFPILIPARGSDTPDSQYTASPTALSTNPMSHNAFFSPPSIHASNSAIASSMGGSLPLTPPSEEDPLQPPGRARSKSKGHVRQESTSAEFLTMLASQERKVLELKEELIRAETELTALKKQWAQYEAGKKKNETKGAPVRMGPVHPSHNRAASVVEANTGLGLLGIEDPVDEEKLEAERERRREMVRDRMMGRVANTEPGQNANGSTKKNGQRVFSSSRHTRTLSLLTATTTTPADRTGSEAPAPGKSSLDAIRQPSIDTPPTTASTSTPVLSRANSGLEGINLGKTYKDLASASRKNLPPGLSPEQFVKTGKQVVDGVRDGLWNFFEDIRQATVGEEAITGAGNGMRRQNSTRNPNTAGNPKLRRTMTDGGERARGDTAKENETSFWKEFGMDTPKTDKARREQTENSNGRPQHIRRTSSAKHESADCCAKHNHHNHTRKKSQSTSAAIPKDSTTSPSKHSATNTSSHESKSSTDSRHPPSLMADLLDDEDDSWDNWDSNTDSGNSPRAERKRVASGRGSTGSGKGGDREVQWHDLMS